MWVEMRMVRLALSFPKMARKRIRSSGSSPTVGSSTMMNSGSAKITCAMPSRRRIPPEKVPVLRSHTS